MELVALYGCRGREHLSMAFSSESDSSSIAFRAAFPIIIAKIQPIKKASSHAGSNGRRMSRPGVMQHLAAQRPITYDLALAIRDRVARTSLDVARSITFCCKSIYLAAAEGTCSNFHFRGQTRSTPNHGSNPRGSCAGRNQAWTNREVQASREFRIQKAAR